MSAEEQKAYFQNKMLNLLSRRKTEEEVRQYLKKQQCPEEIADTLIAMALDYRFIDDEAYARDYIEDSRTLKNRSRKEVRYELMHKGISADILDAAFEETLLSDEDTAAQIIRKRLKDPDDAQERVKLASYLVRRGFSYEIVSRLLKEEYS
ncbi:MAG: regulatory protein RecX [Firmicutes bacterium]|nr:regulatory protein RecX [Bacillota bacterium]